MSRVAIVKGTRPVEMTVKALEKIGSEVDGLLSEKRPILIKPNYINSRHPSTGITTDARVLEGIVEFLRKRKVQEIAIGAGSGFADTFEAFQAAGVDAVAERWGVKLVDLNKDEFVEVKPPDPLSLKSVKLAKTALESTIISVPKLKPHRIATITLSLKNMMGPWLPRAPCTKGDSAKESRI
jgi:uncharacterized protein (DUF362 family)